MRSLRLWKEENPLGIYFTIYTQTALWSWLAGFLFFQSPVYQLAPDLWKNLLTGLLALSWGLLIVVPILFLKVGPSDKAKPTPVNRWVQTYISERVFFTIMTCSTGIIAFTSSARVFW